MLHLLAVRVQSVVGDSALLIGRPAPPTSAFALRKVRLVQSLGLLLIVWAWCFERLRVARHWESCSKLAIRLAVNLWVAGSCVQVITECPGSSVLRILRVVSRKPAPADVQRCAAFSRTLSGPGGGGVGAAVLSWSSSGNVYRSVLFVAASRAGFDFDQQLELPPLLRSEG